MRKKRRYPFSKKQVSAIKRISERTGELKSQIYQVAEASIVTANVNLIDPLWTLSEAAGNYNRIGDEITVNHIYGLMQFNAGTAAGTVRVVGIQQLGDTALTSGVFNENIPAGLFVREEVADTRYQILLDRTFHLDPTVKQDHLLRFFIPGKKLKIKKWVYDSGASTKQERGYVLFYILTNNATASQITMDGNIRLSYYDA